MTSPVVPVEALGQTLSATQQLPEPQPIDFSTLPGKPSTPASGGAYADLRAPETIATNSVAPGWTALAKQVAQGSHEGLVAPAAERLKQAMELRAQDPSKVAPEQVMVLALDVSQATTVTTMLSSTVNSVRKTVTTLVERTG
ncbi:MAG: hypothetical protein AB8C46_07895 [Burkholderiaceae bacterium]